MHKLLNLLLEKRGVKLEELSAQEKADFDRWNKTLIQEPITLGNLEEFIKEQLNKAQDQIAEPENTKEKDLYLKSCLNIYKALLGVIETPQVEKEQVEKYLKQLLQ